jgi:hypothetical protein
MPRKKKRRLNKKATCAAELTLALLACANDGGVATWQHAGVNPLKATTSLPQRTSANLA